MREHCGNIWESRADVIVLPTNGGINTIGNAVMGRGLALQAKQKFPGIDKLLGQMIVAYGNVPNFIARITPTMLEELGESGQLRTRLQSYDLWSWPVKHHYSEPADLLLIEAGLPALLLMAEDCAGSIGRVPQIAIPRPGCGNGLLGWDVVKPVIEHVLDDRFTVYYSPAFEDS